MMDVPCQVVEDTLVYVTDPNAAVEIRGAKWHALWGRDKAQYGDMVRTLSKERKKCINEEDYKEVSVQMVEAGIKKCSADTTPGTDA